MDKIRIDKWLWAARFFKTRSLAVDEIGKGRVQVNAQDAKLLYEETPESLRVRELAAEQRRLAPEPALGITQGRPTKRDRRDISQAWGDRWSASIDD
jgi:ribosome-associated heat shock protein Hsp15